MEKPDHAGIFTRGCVTGFLLPVALILILVIVSKIDDMFFNSREYDAQQFNKEEWLTKPHSERYEMLKDLQYYYLADGMQKAEVVQLLGAPSHQTDRRMEYEIGSSGMLICDKSLYFLTDEKDRVITFGVQ